MPEPLLRGMIVVEDNRDADGDHLDPPTGHSRQIDGNIRIERKGLVHLLS